MPEPEPPPDCPLCPRLAAFRAENCRLFPGWHNAPVPSFGDPDPRLVVVGLAPGLKGANRTGRPFTGDHAGRLLFATLARFGLATGTYEQRPDDTLRLEGVRIVNAVRCVPPQNKPLPSEIATCRGFLEGALASHPGARTFLALGRIAHDSLLVALGEQPRAHPFAHGAEHRLSEARVVIDSYHCSRQNTNTGRLTTAMFEEVVRRAARIAGA